MIKQNKGHSLFIIRCHDKEHLAYSNLGNSWKMHDKGTASRGVGKLQISYQLQWGTKWILTGRSWSQRHGQRQAAIIWTWRQIFVDKAILKGLWFLLKGWSRFPRQPYRKEPGETHMLSLVLSLFCILLVFSIGQTQTARVSLISAYYSTVLGTEYRKKKVSIYLERPTEEFSIHGSTSTFKIWLNTNTLFQATIFLIKYISIVFFNNTSSRNIYS